VREAGATTSTSKELRPAGPSTHELNALFKYDQAGSDTPNGAREQLGARGHQHQQG
jgi:hypothetical protein